MKIQIDDYVPKNFTDEQKRTAICEWFVRDGLKYAECFIRAELNHVPHKMKITIEKPIVFKDELIDFADIVIDYETPQKKLHKKDEYINKKLGLTKSLNLIDMLEKCVKDAYPETNQSYDRRKTNALFECEYTAPYLPKKELELIGDTRKQLKSEYQDALFKSVADLKDIKYPKFNKERLLISVVPTVEFLKEDINEAIRRVKTLDFYLDDVTQKFIVYWGRSDEDIQKYLQHENIQLIGLYETMYYMDEELKKPGEDDHIPI